MATQGRESVAPQSRRPTADDIEEWLASYLSKLLGIDPEKIGGRISFARYGLDSSASIALTSELGDWLGRELDPTINYSYPTIEALAKHLAE
jgi:acyl carrier protein